MLAQRVYYYLEPLCVVPCLHSPDVYSSIGSTEDQGNALHEAAQPHTRPRAPPKPRAPLAPTGWGPKLIGVECIQSLVIGQAIGIGLVIDWLSGSQVTVHW